MYNGRLASLGARDHARGRFFRGWSSSWEGQSRPWHQEGQRSLTRKESRKRRGGQEGREKWHRQDRGGQTVETNGGVWAGDPDDGQKARKKGQKVRKKEKRCTGCQQHFSVHLGAEKASFRGEASKSGVFMNFFLLARARRRAWQRASAHSSRSRRRRRATNSHEGGHEAPPEAAHEAACEAFCENFPPLFQKIASCLLKNCVLNARFYPKNQEAATEKAQPKNFSLANQKNTEKVALFCLGNRPRRRREKSHEAAHEAVCEEFYEAFCE